MTIKLSALFFLFLSIGVLYGVKYSNIALVMHTGPIDRELTLNASMQTWLRDTNLVVVHGIDFYKNDRRLMVVRYNGNPGCSNCDEPTYLRKDKFFGAHRSM